MSKRMILGVSGASGAILSYHLATALKEHGIELHLILTSGARRTWELETRAPISELTDLADAVHSPDDLAAAPSSGTFRTDGMIVLPCSMKTLAGIVSGYSDNLLLRAADVCMKEDRKVVLCPREMPLSKLHLRNLAAAADLGCIILPPLMSFYSGQTTLQDHIDHFVGKILIQFGLEHEPFKPWLGHTTQ